MDFNLVQEYINKLPNIEDLKNTPKVKEVIEKYSEEVVEECLEKIIDKRHKMIASAYEESEVEGIDFSFDFYIESLREELVVEKGRVFKKVINSLGIMYSEYIGNRFYSEEVLKNFASVFSTYNNLEYNEENGKKVDLDTEMEKLIKKFTNGKDYILLNSIGTALYLVIDSIFKEKKVIMSIGDSVCLPEKIGFQDIVQKANGNLKMVGYVNNLSLKDYLDEINNNEDLVLCTNLLENNINGLRKLSKEDILDLRGLAKTMYITNKVYAETESCEIKEMSDSLSEIMNLDFNLSLIDLSRLAGAPDLGLLVGDEELITKVKENFLSKIMAPNKETKTLFYFTLKMYLDKKESEIYANKYFSLSVDELKEKNRRFIRNLEREIGEYCDLDIISHNSLKLSDILEDYSFERDMVSVAPKYVSASKIEEALRLSDPCILCWRQEETLIFNLQFVNLEDEDIITDKLSEVVNSMSLLDVE